MSTEFILPPSSGLPDTTPQPYLPKGCRFLAYLDFEPGETWVWFASLATSNTLIIELEKLSDETVVARTMESDKEFAETAALPARGYAYEDISGQHWEETIERGPEVRL